MCFPTGSSENPPWLLQNWGIAEYTLHLHTGADLNRMLDMIVCSLVSVPQNLCWMQALRQTESVLWWAPQTGRSQGLHTSQPADRHPPGPSSQAGRGTCQDWGCKMEAVEERSLVVAAGGSFHTSDGAAHPHRLVDYQF